MSDARPPVDWQKGFSNGNAGLLVSRDLINASTIEVRARLADGDLLGAVQLSLDVATFELDLLQSPILIDQMVACALLTISVGETWRDEDLSRLDKPALELLAEGLEQIDARCPRVFDWRGEALLLANTLKQLGEEGELFADSPVSLRTFDYGWSERWAAADAVLQKVEMWEELKTNGASSWNVRRQELCDVLESVEVQGNPVLRVSFSNFVGAERSLRSSLASVRLLRLAVACRLGGELPELLDPLGAGSFEVSPLGDGAVVFRSGVDGDAASGIKRTVTFR